MRQPPEWADTPEAVEDWADDLERGLDELADRRADGRADAAYDALVAKQTRIAGERS